ncbi:type II secretion system F family protein [Nocardiopsis algeriensis]|uniref:type II secretion system F family protein n=1 Tax=Nocardiopsis algeriensis TaxID=1478215 RepID=UPI003B42F06E
MGSVTPLILVAAFGALTGAGLWLTLVSLAALARPRRPRRAAALPGQWQLLKLAGCAAAGGAVWLLTGWPVAGALIAAGCWWGPSLLGPDHRHRDQVAGVEAVAAWTEMLRDLMAGASGLHQAIAATVPIAPEPVREPVTRLAERLRSGRPVQDSLRAFADEVDNPTADLVASALTSAATRHATDLGVLLGTLAEAARDQAAMLVRVAASRARVRTSTRIIVAATLGMAVLMLLFSPDYLAPFDGLLGQLVMAAIGALWATALVWLTRMSRFDLGPRVLAPGPSPTTEAAR